MARDTYSAEPCTTCGEPIVGALLDDHGFVIEAACARHRNYLAGRARTTMDELFAGRVPKLGDTVLCQTCDGTGVNGEYKDIALVRLELRGRRS